MSKTQEAFFTAIEPVLQQCVELFWNATYTTLKKHEGRVLVWNDFVGTLEESLKDEHQMSRLIRQAYTELRK